MESNIFDNKNLDDLKRLFHQIRDFRVFCIYENVYCENLPSLKRKYPKYLFPMNLKGDKVQLVKLDQQGIPFKNQRINFVMDAFDEKSQISQRIELDFWELAPWLDTHYF
jgi:hypothetical protein